MSSRSSSSRKSVLFKGPKVKMYRGLLHEVKIFLHYYYSENRGYAKNAIPRLGALESSLLHSRADNLGANGRFTGKAGGARRSGAVKMRDAVLHEVKIYLH
jgi:hypothetical protein